MNVAAYDAPRPAATAAAVEMRMIGGAARIGVGCFARPTPNGAYPVTGVRVGQKQTNVILLEESR
jgi:hypothetical protein